MKVHSSTVEKKTPLVEAHLVFRVRNLEMSLNLPFSGRSDCKGPKNKCLLIKILIPTPPATHSPLAQLITTLSQIQFCPYVCFFLKVYLNCSLIRIQLGLCCCVTLGKLFHLSGPRLYEVDGGDLSSNLKFQGRALDVHKPFYKSGNTACIPEGH